jgi:hypothetical protein
MAIATFFLMTFSPVATADREGFQADVQETKRGVILFRKCQDAALFGCDLSHAFVASGIKSPSTVLLYVEVRVLNSIGVAMFNNLSSARARLRREATLAGNGIKQLN